MKANRVFLLSSILLIFTVVFIAGCGKKNEGRDASYTMTGMTTIESVDGNEIEKSTLSEEDYNTYVNSVDDIFDEVSTYQDRKYSKDGDVSEAIDKVYDYAEKLKSTGVATTVTKHDTYVFIEFSSGIQYVFMPELESVNAGGDKGLVSIWSVQEGKSGYTEQAAKDADQRATDGAAEKMANSYDNYSWDVNIDDEDVTMQTGMNLSNNQIVLWDGHGGCCEEYGGSFICTREKFTGRIPDDSKLWCTANDHEYVITSNFAH